MLNLYLRTSSDLETLGRESAKFTKGHRRFDRSGKEHCVSALAIVQVGRPAEQQLTMLDKRSADGVHESTDKTRGGV